MGNAGGKLVRSCIKKHRSNIRKKVHIKFVVTYNTTKLNFLQIRKIRYKASIFLCISFSLPRIAPQLHWKNRENAFGKDYRDQDSMICNPRTYQAWTNCAPNVY